MAFDANTYNVQYKRDNYDQILLRVPKGDKERIAQTAAERGMSLNKYILSLIESDKKEEP